MILRKVTYKQKEAVLSSAFKRISQKLPKEDFLSSSPAPFVGRFGYPNINLGILTTPEISDSAWLHDAPNFWSSENYKIPEIINLRAELINSNFKVNVKKLDSVLTPVQEIALSKKPVDVEVKTDKPPKILFKPDSFMAPTGASAKLQKFDLTSSPKIPTIVQKFYDDTDCKSVEALTTLYNKGINENSLNRMLSVGSFGLKNKRRLVPTRFSITAVDDVLGKNLIKEIKDYKESDYLAYFGDYLGNYYLILFFPEVWSYELFETYANKINLNKNKIEYSTDYENYYGRKNYAESCAGGYYACRIGILEKLVKLKKQSSVLALRFITDDYFLPLGVWICRQTTRKALENKPIKFASKELMLTYAKNLIKRKFGIDLAIILKNSILLKNINQQSKLTKFL